MSNSRFEFVKKYEQPKVALPNTFIVVRIDGRSFTEFCSAHNFAKPNDFRQIRCMNEAARAVAADFQDIALAYGHSDEFSFVFRRSTRLFNRREDKIMSCVVSLFTAAYCLQFGDHFGAPPKRIPSFDARIVLYPTFDDIRAYISWRQVDCHINNLYNTTFWTMVNKGGLTTKEAHQRLKGSLSKDKNNLLFEEYGINYNNEPEVAKKGTIYLRFAKKKNHRGNLAKNKERKANRQEEDNMRESKSVVSTIKTGDVVEISEDMIKDTFYEKYEVEKNLA